jgi:hypothetical protein
MYQTATFFIEKKQIDGAETDRELDSGAHLALEANSRYLILPFAQLHTVC